MSDQMEEQRKTHGGWALEKMVSEALETTFFIPSFLQVLKVWGMQKCI